MVVREQLDGALKALELTDQSVLFLDKDQIEIDMLMHADLIPSSVLVVGVKGTPNVEAMTVRELIVLLNRKVNPDRHTLQDASAISVNSGSSEEV